ncbi:phosphopantetheinyl transferase (holo-ACP synthase) [Flavobacterium sp. CG_23.5]|uniref:4'-phosphopantetheinyl transferase family protein n=1 Tax=unclassified Flavobacterium TaxID=196869 RepID=UPI0018C995D3|nr:MULTISPECIES: 4'-phosphopantetheinyl transferase superfamily protein [unclassified Flavobacterium]MBG6111345.1 phosphopantetheinyl transferase (holo-ACP synthase) [Flavobacterium sp. CG_9.10]MBP2282133.1 phosphopantetheinyl transferase (holo-ACP synthase) [Flavobacterium sp. CG_23.5]
MIGNDIVDLALARKESNWQRKGFLDKIFTKKEQLLISNSKNPEIMVWNLWTRKEAAYKIYNRQTGIRGYFPIQLDCFYESENLGIVSCNGNTYYTQTKISVDCIYTIAVTEKDYLNQIINLDSETKIIKRNGIPFIRDELTKLSRPVSISHHGRFWMGITI